KVVGKAFTVKLPVGDNLGLLMSLKEAKPGDILVVDVKGDTYRAIAGDFVIGMMKSLGLRGVVIDGVIRDIQDIKALDFPVFCRSTTVASSTKNGPQQLNSLISCVGVAVESGDLIVGDLDGVVVVPQNQIHEVLEKALEKIKADDEREAKVGDDRDKIIEYID